MADALVQIHRRTGLGPGGKLYLVGGRGGGVTTGIRVISCSKCTRYVQVLSLAREVAEFVSLSGLKGTRRGARGSRECLK